MNIDRALIPAGSRVLCAVSGGADSMCLLQLLCERKDITLTVAHFEHGIRGEESRRDADFVAAWCAERQILCVVEHGDVPSYARERGIGLEEAARELRYAFLERTAERLACDCIATAHNADDNAETVLMSLCRGAGTAGLAGIPPRRGKICRPLLGCSRAEILGYLRARGIRYVVDSTNADEDPTRNFLRLRVLPLMRLRYPQLSTAFHRASALLRQDEDCLSSLAEDFLRERFDGESLPTAALLDLHPAVSSRVLRKLAPRGLTKEQVDATLDFCRGSELGALDLPGLRLRREQGRLYVDDGSAVQILPRQILPGETVEIPEAGIAIAAERGVYGGEVYDLFKTFLFKCENICGTLYCTGRMPGDRLHPQGRGVGKSLRALFREAGMTQRQRDRTPVLRDEKGVLAALGLGVDERVRPAPGDAILAIRIRELEE